MKAPTGRADSRELVRRIDREITAQAVERVLQTAAPGYGHAATTLVYWEQYGFSSLREADRFVAANSEARYGCPRRACGCRSEFRDAWWYYKRAGRWRHLESMSFMNDRPRRSWHYDYWRIEEGWARRVGVDPPSSD